MKDIKDYLHLYLGCEVQYPDVDGTIIVAKLTGVSRGDGVETTYIEQQIPGKAVGDYLAWKPNGYHNSDALHLKLLLRPLSDMTEEEAVEFIHRRHKSILCNIDRTDITKVSFGSTKNIVNFTYFKQRGAGAEGGGKTYYVNASDPDQFQYLLSKGFDLFGLIEAGLAIDKTKLETVKQ